MTKREFVNELEIALEVLSEEDIRSSLDYYSEIIDDRIESGMSEEEAVAALGSPEDIVRDIMIDMPLPKIIKTKCKQKKRNLHAWEIVLIVLGSPIWLSLAFAALTVVLAVFAAIWSVVITLWAAEVSVVAVTLTCLLIFFVLLGSGGVATAFAMLGAALALAGASIFMFFACRIVSKLTLKLNLLVWRAVKSLFVGKGDKQ